MAGAFKRHQIIQNLFGDQSEDDEQNEKDKGSKLENEGKAKSQAEAKPQGENVPKVLGHYQARSSRSPDNAKDVDPVVLSAAAMRDVLGDSDNDEKPVHGTHDWINKDKGIYIDVVPDDVVTYECETEQTETKLKGEAVDSPVVFEIPLQSSSVCPDQMAAFNVSNVVSIDPKPFDPNTFVEEDFYVTDASGFKRRIPSANIIRWRQVTYPDGTTSVESNARFVTWSDGSLQLFIGNERFDVSEQDAKEIQSHLFVKQTEGIYQARGRISRKMKFIPSSLSSNSHRLLTTLVDSRHKKVNKVKQYISDVDPEKLMEKTEKAEKQISKANKLLDEKKKKVAMKYTTKGCKESQLLSDFLEDASDKDDYEPKNSTALHHFELDQEKEAAARKRLLNAKKGPKYLDRSASSVIISTRGTMPLSSREKAELDHGCKRKEVEGSLLHGKFKEIQEEEEERDFEDSEDEVEVSGKF